MSATWIETKSLPVGILQEFPGNAKRGDVETIRHSIRRHGQYRAIVVRKVPNQKLTILAGNHTYRAVVAEGHDEIRCEIITCTDDEAKRINLADNRTSEIGTYDDDDLLALLTGLDNDFDGTGWTNDEVDRMLNASAEVSDLVPEGDAEIDELPVVWGVVVECDDEKQQVGLLSRFDDEGLRVRALM